MTWTDTNSLRTTERKAYIQFINDTIEEQNKAISDNNMGGGGLNIGG